ncbi:cytochrome P450 2C23-like isoform X2 [Candoia aspera]|uniref:cytochrome P450 2C23-like isoform X2 n=1 Tax=Candoia aspera TaxID=51853 RepID=UPI002FD84EE9
MVLVGAVVLILLGVLCSIVFASFQMYKKKGELPPGPTPWPILGNLFQKNILPLYKSYSKLAKKYGPVFTVWMGPKPLVVLCGYEVVKDALVHHAEEFGGRPDIPFDVRVTKGQGILSKNETKWRELRRFTLSTLRNFGMGKTAMSKRVQEEALCLGEEIATTQGQPFNPKGIIMNATSNVICSVIFGNRFEYGNQTFLKQLYILANEVGYFHSFLGLIYNTFPKIMDYFPGKHTKIFADSEKVCDFIREKVEFHRRTLDPQNPRDYIDCFLIRIPQRIFIALKILSCLCMYSFLLGQQPQAKLCSTAFWQWLNFQIFKNTAVVPMLSSVHFDPLQWETPERFNPDHFLDEKGQFRKRDAFMPFSAGKRACPGEALARMELFLFFSTLLQKFTFHMAGDSKDTDIWSLFMDFRNKNQFPLIRAIRCSETLLFNN